MAYTQEGILAQVYVAFGQGTSYLRVTQEAALTLQALYGKAITDDLIEKWDLEAVQVLERIRAIGRLSAQIAIGQGDTKIIPKYVLEAAAQVQIESDTERCPPGFPGV
jgi:hypothetical protein